MDRTKATQKEVLGSAYNTFSKLYYATEALKDAKHRPVYASSDSVQKMIDSVLFNEDVIVDISTNSLIMLQAYNDFVNAAEACMKKLGRSLNIRRPDVVFTKWGKEAYYTARRLHSMKKAIDDATLEAWNPRLTGFRVYKPLPVDDIRLAALASLNELVERDPLLDEIARRVFDAVDMYHKEVSQQKELMTFLPSS